MNEVALPPRRSLPDAQAWRGEMSDVGLDWVGMQGIALPLELAGKPLMAKSTPVSTCAPKRRANAVFTCRACIWRWMN